MRLDRRLAAILAVLVVGLAVGGILRFGRLAYPAFPSLAEDPVPAIPGMVAWVRWDDDGPCVWVVRAAGGTPRELRCGSMFGGPPSWTEDGSLRVPDHSGRNPSQVLLDPESGRILRRDPLDEDEPTPPGTRDQRADGTRILVDSKEREARLILVEPDGDEREVKRVRGPRDYSWWSAQWSPDGRYVLVADSGQRLLIVRVADGRTWLLATDAGEAAWGP